MDPANPHTIQISLDVFYDNRPLKKKLPTDIRNLEIIKNIEFVKILNHSLKQDKNAIVSWVNRYEDMLKKFLNKKKNKIKEEDLSFYCKSINYLIDIIAQRIRMFDGIEQVEWENNIQQISKRVLRNNHWLNCERNLDNYENRYVYVKKMMYDLCEDIDYIMNNETILNHKHCPIFIKRIEYRKDTLMKIYKSFIDRKYFLLDNGCTISNIINKFENLECMPKAKPTEAMSDNGDTMLTETETPVQESQGDEISSDVMQAQDVEDLESLSLQLNINENSHTEPRLDTTYAAASLAGISLFGTILYKYGPFRSRLNSLRGARNGSNIFSLDNNVYDETLMNNFEYLQTGIPNGEYQLGYGSVTDY
ncbi:PIR protein [Plasmodium vivax]|uniref:VIR protein n=1 Tax=Plasmodium vivax TaxID=5855 RepID=A0A565A6F5_PLAVI|nr:PIR protein [Plasmodium vivax]